MYLLQIPDELLPELQAADNISPSVGDRLVALQNNPFSVAIKTNTTPLSDYYVNAGRWAILFDIVAEEDTVIITHIMRREKLDKILRGKIKG